MTIKNMIADTTIRARINSKIKDDASGILEQMGLNPSAIFRILMLRIAKDGCLPFEIDINNKG